MRINYSLTKLRGELPTSRDRKTRRIYQIYDVMRKILQVSDYITPIGGIEIYIQNASKLLLQNGFEVQSFGLRRSGGFLKKSKSYLLWFTWCNVISAFQIIYKCIRFDPHIIWFHSVSRYHGWLPVLCTKMFDNQKLMMYHDLGYFHPFPSLVTDEQQVLPWSYKNRIRMGKRMGAGSHKSGVVGSKEFEFILEQVRRVGVFFKFVSMSLLRRALLKVVDKHLVPSDFMVQYLIDWGVDKNKIEVLPHFIPDVVHWKQPNH